MWRTPARRVQSARGQKDGRHSEPLVKCTVDLPAGAPSLTTPSSLDRPPRPSKIVSPGCRPKRAFPGVKAGCPPSRRQVAADPHGPTAERTMTRQDGGTEFSTCAILAPCPRLSRTLPAAFGDAPRPFLDRHCARRTPSVQADGKIGLGPNNETVDPETVNSGKVGRAPSWRQAGFPVLAIFR